MSIPETEVKATAEVASLKSRVTALEVDAKTWYEKHLAAILGFAGLLLGFAAGHIKL